MNGRMMETVIGALVLMVAGIFIWFVYNQRVVVSSGEGYTVEAVFDNAAGIAAGSEVRIAGIKVGTVLSLGLEKETYRSLMRMQLIPDVAIPDDSSAAIVSESLLGGKYVQLVPGADEAMLKDGGKIKFTQSAVNLEEMIGKFMFSGGGVDKEGGEGKPASDSAASTLE